MESGRTGRHKLLFHFKEVTRNLLLDPSVVLFRTLYLSDRLCSRDVNLVSAVNKLPSLSSASCEGYLVILIDYQYRFAAMSIQILEIMI